MIGMGFSEKGSLERKMFIKLAIINASHKRKLSKCLKDLPRCFSIILRKFYYFLTYLYFKYIKRIKIGKGCRISILADISGNVVIGKHVTIERGAVIKGNVKIGDHTMIGAYASITTTPTGYIEIGNFCHINNFNIIGSCKRVIIKDYALFAVGVKITDSSRDYSSLKLPTKKAPIISEDIVIEENVWCGFDVCIIMGGE